MTCCPAGSGNHFAARGDPLAWAEAVGDAVGDGVADKDPHPAGDTGQEGGGPIASYESRGEDCQQDGDAEFAEDDVIRV